MSEACDYAWNGPTAQQLKDAGYVSAGRYLSHDDSKDAHTNEINALWEKGVGVFFYFETVNQRAALSGAFGGREDVKFADDLLDSLGCPHFIPIYYVLEDPNKMPLSAWGSIDAYAAAVKENTRRSHVGGYGSEGYLLHAMQAGFIDHAVQVGGWSDGVNAAFHLLQRSQNAVANTFGGKVDDLYVIKADHGQWMPGAPVPPPGPAPAPPPAPGPVILHPGQPAPPYPLPGTDWYGAPASSPRNHSGFFNLGDRGGIATFQAHLVWRGWQLSVDGQFGPQTAGVVGEYQKEAGLVQDRLVGPQTWGAIWTKDVTR